VKEDSLHYCYRVEREEVDSRLQQTGLDLACMVDTFEKPYGQEKAYLQVKRVFAEHFRFEEKKIVIKEGKELGGATLQSPDDEEATFRTKSRESSRGYAANITETCDPDNGLQLVTAISVAPNITDDQELLAKDLVTLKERTGIGELITDAGYGGPVGAEAVKEQAVSQKTSAIKGRKKNENALGLEDFNLTKNEKGDITALSCPHDQPGEIRPGRTPGRYTVGFDGTVCSGCPLRELCPACPLKKRGLYVYRFTDNDVRVAEQRRQVEETGKEALNLRASVESTVRSVIHPFGGHLCKMPVRGKARITAMAVLSAAMVNIHRITKYLRPPKIKIAYQVQTG